MAAIVRASFLLAVASAAFTGLLRGVTARPSQDLNPEPPSLNHVGRELKQSFNGAGPAQAGCTAAGLSCCYSPTWWLDEAVPASVTCTTGTQNALTPETLLQACQDGVIGESNAPCSYLEGCTDTAVNVVCTYYENIGDYTVMPCSSNDWNGQSIQAYDPSNIKELNTEIVWADATVPSNEPTGVEACNTPGGATYTLTATYSKSSSWNIGIQLGAKILKDYEAKLTAGYSQTYSKGTNAGVTVPVAEGYHGTVTSGTLVHHALGWWDVKLASEYGGCSEYRVDNVAADLIMPTSDPNFPTDWGVETKPCGYPLLSGALN